MIINTCKSAYISLRYKLTERSSSSSTCFSINLDISGIRILNVALAKKQKEFQFITDNQRL